MFGMGMPELMLIMAVALVVIGPKKLPGLAKSIGRAMSEFKGATRDFKRSIDLDSDLPDARDSMNNLKDIPTYDPEQSAYKGADTTRPADNASDATETTDAQAETTDAQAETTDAQAETTDVQAETTDAQAESAENVKSSPGPEADEPPSPGAKSHG